MEVYDLIYFLCVLQHKLVFGKKCFLGPVYADVTPKISFIFTTLLNYVQNKATKIFILP